ncbi:hypothetical protein [Endozoicomonas lisbonensis]|uniref:Conjugal transfer/entry exclusion protein n=1 Tax=Endozoicomonas lisbonensis TaxID=3120522 RepID=A0ABV2SCI8_9GAMM
MQPSNTTGTTGTAGLEHFYPGMDDQHTLNSKGEFVNLSVRKVENTVNKLISNRNNQLQQVQNATQTSVYERRIKILKKHGDFHTSTERLNNNSHKGRKGKLGIIDDKVLKENIDAIKDIATDKLADKPIGNDKDNKIVVSKKGLKKRAQEDLSIFFSQSIDEAKTPQTLQTLHHFISKEAKENGITSKQLSALNKALINKADDMTRALPQTLLSASKKDNQPSHKTETKKLQYVHDLHSMLNTVAPGVLKVHKSTIHKEAVKAFINATNHLEPHSSSFGETRKILEGIESDKKELLQPVLNATSKDTQQVNRTLVRINEAIENTVKVMKNQLAQIKNRTQDLQTAAKQLSGYQQDLSKLTTKLKAKVRDLESKESEYTQLRDNAGSKLKRRFNVSYQWARRANRIEKNKLGAQKEQLQQQFKELKGEILDQKRQYAYLRAELRNIHKKFSDSQDVSSGDAIDPRSAVGNTKFDEILSGLEARNEIDESDVVTAHQYFSTLAQSDVPEETIERMAAKYKQLVEKESFDGYQALWVISNSYTDSSGSNFEDDCAKEIAYLTEQAQLTPAHSPKLHRKTVNQPESLQLESRLAKVNSLDTADYSNSGIANYVKEMSEQNPQLKAEINEICEFYLDGLENDLKAFDNNSTGFNELFVDHYTALGVGIRALVDDHSSAKDACSQMANYLQEREEELNRTSHL